MAGSSEDLPRFCYPGGSYGGGNQHPPPHISGHHMHNFESNAAIYNLTAGMEMIGFPPKNLHQTAEASSSAAAYLWKSAVHGGGNHPSSSREMGGDYYHTDWHNPQDWHPTNPNRSSYLVDDDDSSLRCVFPCEPNERPSQGLSLSLSSSNPSAIVLQSFELRQHGDTRFGPSSSKPPSSSSQVIVGHEQQQQSILRSSKYLVPAQELLKEFCNLGTKQTQKKSREYNHEDESAIKTQSLYTLDLIELQRRKAKLLQLLEEVDRRYKHYCHQMMCVVSSFESIAGHGSATVYLSMASKAMSRHFRCLRDGIERQMRATKKAMGEMDASAPGTMKGETPRLRLIDQTLRQQRAMQNMSVMESHPWRPQRGLPERAVSILRAWLFEHFLHPYPCDVDKHILARQTGLSRSQVSNWFINARVRLWKPMVEEMYLEELKGGEDAAMADGDLGENIQRNEDEKPGHEQLLRMDSECLSSIINNNNAEKNEMKRNKAIQNEQQRSSSGFINSYGGGGGGSSHDFSSYGAAAEAVSYGVGSGVSLTLGLHQHGGDMNSLFYGGREQMEECQTGGGQYSLLDGENQNLPYRNLMGAQLLHDLAG